MTRRDPFVGFGDDTNSSVKFQLVHDRGKTGDWTRKPRMAQREVVLSSRTVTQVWGTDPWEATLRLLFDRPADYALFEALQGQRATLRILADVTIPASGVIQPLLGTRYIAFPETLLSPNGAAIKTIASYRSGIRVVEAVFQIAADLDTYVGFPSTGEDEA